MVQTILTAAVSRIRHDERPALPAAREEGDAMATRMMQTLPEGVPVEMLDAVTKEMNVDTDPPQGMIVHVHYVEQGRARVVDVWESQDYQRFADSRLLPDLHSVVRGR